MTTREIEINGKKYPAAEITFGTVREMTKMGVNFNSLGSDLFGLVSAYVRVSTHLSQSAVDELLQRHIVGGGGFDGIIDTFKAELEESDFFQALAKTEKTETE